MRMNIEIEAATLNFVDVHKILGETFHTKAKVSSRVPTCACDTIRIIKFYFTEFTLSGTKDTLVKVVISY